MTPAAPSLALPPALLLPQGKLVDVTLPEWSSFAQNWDAMPHDTWMADGGTYRRRRYAAFHVEGGVCERLPHRAHFQDRNHNPLNGGVARWFAPMEESQSGSTLFRDLVRSIAALIAPAAASPAWIVEAHQFRIEAMPGQRGLPTPEGMHQDGRDWVLILFVGGSNYSGGETRVENAAGTCLLEHRLTHSGEALLLDDQQVWHGTTPIDAESPGTPAWRDTLVLTFAQADGD